MFRVGFPGWTLAARWGIPLLIKLDVRHDKQAGVVIITSPDLKGLIVEAADSATAEELHRELNDCVYMLMTEILSGPPKSQAITAWPGEFLPA